MEDYIYIDLYVIIEAMIIWILEWRDWGWGKQMTRQRIRLLSYLRYLQKVKLDGATDEGSLASENESNHVLVPANTGCRSSREDAKSSTPVIVTPNSSDLDVMKRPFLYDPDLFADNIKSKPSEPRPLIPWTDFRDVTSDYDVLTGKDGEFQWDCEEMFHYNEVHFGYKSSLDKDLSDYTTPLIREDTDEYRRRWERACRLSEEIKTPKLTYQATQVSKKKQRI